MLRCGDSDWTGGLFDAFRGIAPNHKAKSYEASSMMLSYLIVRSLYSIAIHGKARPPNTIEGSCARFLSDLFRGQLAEVVQLCSAHATFLDDFDLLDAR